MILFRRPWLAVGVWAALILVSTSIPGKALPQMRPGSDKIAHLLSYGVLGGLLANAWRREHSQRGTLLVFLMSVGAAAGYGIFDEWHQEFFGREPALSDWWADVAGAAGGAAAVLMAPRNSSGVCVNGGREED